MLFTIFALDRPDASEVRNNLYPGHRQHVAGCSTLTILQSGPIKSADNTIAGSLFLCEAENQKIVEEFHHRDPFYKGGVYEESYIYEFDRKR